jgi:cyclic pyranopterin phosphate synthase
VTQPITTTRLRRPLPAGEPAAYVTRFFERVAGLSALFLGNACNQRCLYCDTPHTPRVTLPLADARALVDRMAGLGLRRLMLIGGEPTIWRDLPALVAYARAGVPDVIVATNGLMLAYPQYLQRLVDAGLTGVHLSLDDFAPATQRALSANPRADVLLAQALDNLVAHPELFLFVVAVVTRLNRAHLPAYVAGLAALGARRGAPVPAIVTQLKPLTLAQENRALLMEPVRVVAPAIIAALERGRERGVEIIHKELPPCQTPGYEAYGWGANMVEYMLDAGGAERPAVYSPLMTKHADCAACRFEPVCGGVYRNYVEEHGWDEFRPVR